jgi:FlaA1/EpsC-like NDP-sugar epimerase
MNSFLSKQSHSVTIAKIATIFQSTLTTVLCVLLALSLHGSYTFITSIGALLTLDAFFVVCHLTYRILYRGPQTKLANNTKIIIFVHSIFSVIALGLTAYFVTHYEDIPDAFILTTILTWFISLIFGDMFFREKYSNTRT